MSLILPTRRGIIRAGAGALAAAATPARAWKAHGGGAYLGLVCTRCQTLGTPNATYSYVQSRSFHFARTAFNQLQVMLPGWFQGYGENTLTGNVVYQAWLEYPIGTLYQFKWSGSGSVTATAGSCTPLSDVLALPNIPNGATVYLNVLADFHLTYGACYGWPVTAYAAGGDGCLLGTSAFSAPTGGAIGLTAGAAPIFPMALVAPTNKPAVFIMGDSRQVGYGDTADSSGDTGEFARLVGSQFAYFNGGSGGEQAATALGITPYAWNYGAAVTASGFANRSLVAPYTTHVMSGYGVNDMNQGSATNSGCESYIQQCWGLVPHKPIFQATIMDFTVSTDNFKTIANQSGSGTPYHWAPLGANISNAINTWLRAYPAGLNYLVDVSSAIETSTHGNGLNSGQWPADGVTQYLSTPDGLHESAYMLGVIKTSLASAVQSAIHF